MGCTIASLRDLAHRVTRDFNSLPSLAIAFGIKPKLVLELLRSSLIGRHDGARPYLRCVPMRCAPIYEVHAYVTLRGHCQVLASVFAHPSQAEAAWLPLYYDGPRPTPHGLKPGKPNPKACQGPFKARRV